MMFPLTSFHSSGIHRFSPLSMPPPILPLSFIHTSIRHYLSEIAMRLSHLKWPFFDATVVPASAPDAVFKFGGIVDLAEVIVHADIVVRNVRFGAYYEVVWDMWAVEFVQRIEFLLGLDRNVFWDLVKNALKKVYKIVIGETRFD